LKREDALPAMGQKLFQVNVKLSFGRLDFFVTFFIKKKSKEGNCIKAKEQNN
jgi:hypothetical protein